jgi:transposase
MVNLSLGSVRDIRNNSLDNLNNIGHNHFNLNSLSHNSNNNRCKNHFSVHNSLNIFYQNIKGLQVKTNELISSLHPELPHVLCLSTT